MKLPLLTGLLLCAALARTDAVVAQSKNILPVASKAIADSLPVVANADSQRLADIRRYYNLGKQYKDGNGAVQNFAKAVYYFRQAADLGDQQSKYALGYMHYKGLGTSQDYALAASLFAQGAYSGRDNSMYFYGLCWRNGYGVIQNEDSAGYWLGKAAAQGYRQAAEELKAKTPENDNADASKMLGQIHNAALPQQAAVNQFVVVTPVQPDSSALAGEYTGYIIQYDWSGKYPVSTKKLGLTLNAPQEKGAAAFTGRWMEDGTDSAGVTAFIKQDSLVFTDTHYKRKDHYSYDSAIQYNFSDAALNIVRKGDSVFLVGNVYMFSPERNEPSKPILLALERTMAGEGSDSAAIKKQTPSLTDSSATTQAAVLLNVYPNPFESYVNVSFRVNRATSVGVELYDMGGRRVYQKPAQVLAAGTYTITVQPDAMLPQQTYLLRLIFSGGQQTVKIIKK